MVEGVLAIDPTVTTLTDRQRDVIVLNDVSERASNICKVVKIVEDIVSAVRPTIMTSADQQKDVIEMNCVPERAPKVDILVKIVECNVPVKPTVMTSADPQKDIITNSSYCHKESIAATASINSLAALEAPSFTDDMSVEISTSMGGIGEPNLSEGLDLKGFRKFNRSNKIRNTNMSSVALYDDLIVPKFRDDDSVEPFTEYAGGIGRTSLPQELNLKALNKVGVIQSEHKTLYESAQLVSVRFLQVFRPRRVVDDGFNRVKKEHRRHLELVERVSHENVAPVRAYYCSFGALKQRYLTLVYDYNEKDSVFEMLHGKKQVPFPWDARLRVAIGVAKGIAFIHAQDNGFYHGDIISQHIYMNAKSYGCISDLGSCISGYADGAKCCQQSDIYNYGVLLLELVTGNPPGFFLQNSEVHSKLVNEFKEYFTSSRELLVSKVGYFVRRKPWKSEETLNFQVLDCELLKHYEKFGGQMLQMLRIALHCVSDKVPKMDDVVKMVEGIRLYDGSDGSS
ncbi:hypothetical protein MKW98_029317 [Papaver atlanticum]|uniref:Protein kinase domain-containing protein n=1 Tax=Papaver atlanticum TaxID=357466 RepID=A0AAD4SKM3_9MAGN|nr:hypothetical protein MKW98_029317 [Papaver atlanticum]